MKNSNFALIILMSLLFISCSKKNVLENIENYKAPTIASKFGEPYDNKLKDNKPLPKKLTDVLVYDVWLILTKTLELKGISPSNIKKEDILKGLEVYRNKDWNDVIGLRPYTHSTFIKSLSNDDLLILAENIETHIKENGIWEKPIQTEPEEIDIPINIADTLPSN